LLSQQLLQLEQLPHDFLQWNRPSRPPHFFLQPPQPLLQQLLQAGASQQVGSAAQHVGAASQQVGSQLDAQQLDLQLWQANRPLKPPNRPQCLWPQPLLQLLQLPQAGASQQVGSAAQHEGAAASQQVGSAAQQPGSAAQQVGSAAQQVGSLQLLQHVLHPPQPPER
jgi:hypothetical protein